MGTLFLMYPTASSIVLSIVYVSNECSLISLLKPFREDFCLILLLPRIQLHKAIIQETNR